MRQPIVAAFLALLGMSALAHQYEAKDRNSYAVVIGEKAHLTNLDLDAFLRVRKSTRGDFIWVKRNRTSYRIDDAPTLQKAAGAMRMLEPFEREQERIHSRIKPLEEQERTLDREQEKIEDALERAGDDARAERELRQVETKLRKLEQALRVIEAEERDFEQRQEAVEEKLDAAIERLIDDAIRRGIAKRVE